jgi:hypothetical protein
MSNQFLCKCGHPRGWHERLMPHDQTDCCLRCIDLKKDYEHDYEPDNLRYLEDKDAENEIR